MLSLISRSSPYFWQRPLEADPVLVLDHQLHEAAELFRLASQVRVEQRLIALAPAPQHVVRASQPVRGFEDVFHLGRRAGKDLRVRVRRSAGGIARVPEEVGRAPEQPDAAALHRGLDVFEDRIEVRAALAKAGALGRDVSIVEAEEGSAQLLEELEGHLQLAAGLGHGIAAPRSEDIVAGPAEAVPVTDGEAQMVLHPPAQHDAVRIVEAEGERVLRLRALVADTLHAFEERLRHRLDLPARTVLVPRREAVEGAAASLALLQGLPHRKALQPYLTIRRGPPGRSGASGVGSSP